MKICQLQVPIDLVRVVYSSGRFMPRVCWIGCDSVVCTHIFLTVWFQRERCKALQAVTIMGHAFSPIVKSTGGKYYGSQYLGTSNDELTFRSDDELAW
jgi:hypothetical protein